MSLLRCLALALCLIALPALAQSPRISAAASVRVQAQGEAPVFVLLKAPAATRDAASARLHPQVRLEVDRVLAGLPQRARTRSLRRYQHVPGFALRADAATLAALARDPRVARVDLDVGGSGGAVAPDNALALNNLHELAGAGYSGAGMKVAVIDTGIDTDHADFAGRIVGQACFCSGGGTGCCPNGGASQSGPGSAEDDHGHGTNVAGIIGGNGTVAPRGALPQVSLVAVKVLDRNNRFCCTSDIVAALDWLATNHPDVDAVNLSLGTDAQYAGDCDGATSWTQALSVAIGNLNALGAVVTVSSGNQGSLNAMAAPACVRNAVSTGATWDFHGGAITYLGCSETSTAPLQPTCFANRSATTDLFGASAFVTAAGINGGSSTYGGTSQAAPQACACAAALKQAAPASTVAQRMEAMALSHTRIQDPASGRSYPLLNCRDAFGLLNPEVFGPIAMNGSQPLIPPADPPAGLSVAPKPAPVPASQPAALREAPARESREPRVRGALRLR
ncbi:S8 family serine peptidase [Lysobacter sp. 5GHs7-4]|uniref:S8 family peptidase n=1 Tax=Lysobacter sp. 5GHs7-4 TaxID=2904253 RepID=UPI001E41AF4F|nr:S8 family serine peptidase [Lysobacter sp. 5GHs7-4]UHQ24819.1 S8 family serine peptidase [Lysobacter sp. 5GHs7-4]